MSQPKVDGAELHRQMDSGTDGDTSPDTGGEAMSLFGMEFTMTHIIIVVILLGLAVVYLGNKDEDTDDSGTDAEPDKDAQAVLDELENHSPEDEQTDDIKIEHDPNDPLKADTQAMDVIWGSGRAS